MTKYIDINAQTKVGELLDTYPELEETLLQLSPSFAKLKNPILRKTIGRIASLRQVAAIGGLNLGEMILKLKRVIGLEDFSIGKESLESQQSSRPKWANREDVSLTYDASDIIGNGESPMKIILEKAERLAVGETMLLITPFRPIPIIELLDSRGYQSWSENVKSDIYTYITNLSS